MPLPPISMPGFPGFGFGGFGRDEETERIRERMKKERPELPPELKRQAPEVFTETADKTYFGYWLDHVRGDFTASRRTPLHDTDNTARCAGRANAGVRGA